MLIDYATETLDENDSLTGGDVPASWHHFSTAFCDNVTMPSQTNEYYYTFLQISRQKHLQLLVCNGQYTRSSKYITKLLL